MWLRRFTRNTVTTRTSAFVPSGVSNEKSRAWIVNSSPPPARCDAALSGTTCLALPDAGIAARALDFDLADVELRLLLDRRIVRVGFEVLLRRGEKSGQVPARRRDVE